MPNTRLVFRDLGQQGAGCGATKLEREPIRLYDVAGHGDFVRVVAKRPVDSVAQVGMGQPKDPAGSTLRVQRDDLPLLAVPNVDIARRI